MNPTTRERRIKAGLCIKCGNKLDRDRRTCSKCADVIAKEDKEARQWYLKAGICPICKKEMLFSNEKSCLECKAKSAVRSEKQRENNKERYNKSCANSHRKTYWDRKENGLCTRCGKRKADDGALCNICNTKKNNYLQSKRNEKNGGVPRCERVYFGLCYTCGNTLDRDGKMCSKCAERVTNNLKKDSGGGKHWSNANRIIFQKQKGKRQCWENIYHH